MPMQQTSITTDFLVVGGGVIGINIAQGLKERYPTSKVTLIEKESACGMHASGRNSGVLHAGFYYSPDSLKAKFTRDGNAQLTAYCEEKRISLNRCGKLVVAKDATDLPALDELLKRGKANGIKLEELGEQDANEVVATALVEDSPRIRAAATQILQAINDLPPSGFVVVDIPERNV